MSNFEGDETSASILGEINYIIDLLRTMQNAASRDTLLQRLQDLVGLLENLSALSAQPGGEAPAPAPVPDIPAAPIAPSAPEGAAEASSAPRPAEAVPIQGARREFTREELAYYNGTNGYPSYVAVNGIVYDVTNIPIWQTGTHFGLRAGQDLSVEFNICHSNRPMVLDELRQVGRLVDPNDETYL